MTDFAKAANDFKDQYDGKHIDEDGYYGAQCWDVSARYAREKVGCPSFPTVTGGAEGLFSHTSPIILQYFDKLPADQAQAGDIGVCPASFSPPWGHTFVILARNGTSLNVFEQNGNNPGGNAYVKVRYISNLSGVLRPKQQGVNDMIPDRDHLNALFRAFRGRNAADDEAAAYIGKMTYSGMVEALDSGTDRAAVVNALTVGQLAVKDNWQQQIYTLQAALDAANKAVALANSNLTAARQQLQDIGTKPTQAQIDALTKQLQDAEAAAAKSQADYEKAHADLLAAQSQQTADTATGNSFVRWIGGLFNKTK